jgi:MarR family transcriptional regulator, organic hydroperoxide resistance regulator
VAAEPDAEHRPTIEQLRLALVQMLGAERRLRGRDHNRAGELTYGQVRALATLGRGREMTAGQLARSAELNPATVTAILDHLEAAQIVQRHRSTEDRRVCNVSLTPQGRALLERKLAYWQAQWAQKFADFSDDELAVAARVIGRVTDVYDGLATAPQSDDPQSDDPQSTDDLSPAGLKA